MSYGSGSHRNTNPWNRSNTSSSYSSDNQAYQEIGNVSYPISKRTYSDNYGNSYSQSSLSSSNKSKTIRGYVTRLYDTWGLIDNDCHFSFSVCVKGIPKMNDHVLADSVYSPNPQYKWKATRVQILNSDRDFSNIKSLMGSRSQNDFDSRKRVRSPLHRDKSRDRRYDDGDRKRFKRDDKEKSKDLSERDSHRERDKPKEIERSPIRRRSKTPVKRRLVRYAVKVPTELLNLSSADIVTLKKRYPALYIPSDFFISNFCWTETFPLHKPFTLDKPCAFHIMHKDCDSFEKNDAILDPPDLDFVFSAKVLLMSIPSLDEIYKKSVCLAEELNKEDDRGYTYLTRLVQFLVGTRGKGDPLAIGGPWSPFLDGENPDKDPSVLIKTAIRTCKALTGIDLSGCSSWYRFMEVYYHRSESVHKGKTIPARIETVVFFLPEVWNCVPTCLEWEDVILNYKKILDEKLEPKINEDSASQTFHSDQAEESDKEEDLVVIDKCEDKLEPTPYSELDPKNMKVNELRQELEARSLSTKGLKSQLISRLVSALKKEEDEPSNTTESNIEADTVVEDEKYDIDDFERSEESLMEVDKVEDERIEDEGTDIVEPKIMEPIDRASLEKKYSLPDTPHIIVHPSKNAKSGKFDCTVLSLASLLDYRTNENKEHSFELYMFAELFHEMLQRDFGFSIYKKFCELPEKMKEEKDDKEKKDDKETTKQGTPDKHAISDDKNEKDASTEDSKDEQKSKKEDSEGKKDESEKEKTDDTKLNGIKAENGSKSDESKKKERVKLVTKDPHLLLSFSFFDRTHCGYIFDKDLETIIFSLGLQLSRHQTKKLIAKVTVRDTVHYRKLTDKPEGEEDEQNLLPVNVAELAQGNRKFFPIFTDAENVDDTQKTPTSRRTRKGKDSVSPAGKCTGLISVGGSVVDVEKVTSSLKKSESSRLEIERQLFKYKKDYDSLKETLKKSSDKERRINEDLQVCRDKLMSANKEKITLMNKSRTYYKLLTSIKDQISAVEEKPEKVSKSSKSSDKSEEKTPSKVKKESNDDDTHEKSESTGHHESTKEGQSKAELKESSKKISSSEKTEESVDNVQSDA